MQKFRRPNRWKGTVQVLALAILLRAGYEVWYRIDPDTTWSMFARMASFPVLYLTALLLVGISLVFKWTGKGDQLVSPSMGFLMAVTLNAGLRSLDLLRLPGLCSPEKLFDFETFCDETMFLAPVNLGFLVVGLAVSLAWIFLTVHRARRNEN